MKQVEKKIFIIMSGTYDDIKMKKAFLAPGMNDVFAFNMKKLD